MDFLFSLPIEYPKLISRRPVVFDFLSLHVLVNYVFSKSPQNDFSLHMKTFLYKCPMVLSYRIILKLRYGNPKFIFVKPKVHTSNECTFQIRNRKSLLCTFQINGLSVSVRLDVQIM